MSVPNGDTSRSRWRAWIGGARGRKDSRASELLSALPAAIFETDADGRVERSNRRFEEVAGPAAERLAGRPWTQMADQAHRGELLFAWDRARDEGNELEQRVRLAGDVERWALVRICPVPGGPGWMGVLEDVTESLRVEADLARRATHDPLTDLPNRPYFEQRLEEARERARRARSDIALLFVDLNRFKEVNDQHGHAAGDELLRAVGRRLTACLRASDTVARYGGDEFTLLCEDVHSTEEPIAAAQRISDALEEPFEVAGRPVSVRCSVGIAVSQAGAATGPELIAAADSAMYRAKAASRPFQLAAEAPASGSSTALTG